MSNDPPHAKPSDDPDSPDEAGVELQRSLELETPPGQIRTAYISGNTFRARAVQFVEVDGLAIFEGDIVLGTVDEVEHESEQLKLELRGEVESGVIITGSQYRWQRCQVPYDIDPSLPSPSRVTNAIDHWESNTNFRFVVRTAANAAAHPDYVTFRPGSGCSSSVGRRGGQQFVNLAPGCTTGSTIHEIGHVAGMWHEHSRQDRDAFVTINWANIQAGTEHNFNQHISDGDDVGQYDYGSIMHYGRTGFSIDGVAETITPTDATAVIGQRNSLSPGDIATANSMCGSSTLVETIKELAPETLKERFPETLKEFTPETLKERIPETIKERIPETVKELAPETIKERIPETIKEHGEPGGTWVEAPTFPGAGGRLDPAQSQLPFALRTPHQGEATPAISADETAAVNALQTEISAVAEALGQIDVSRQELLQEYQRLAAVLSALGL